MIRTLARWLLALFFIVAGCNHFRVPEMYLSMMPSWLPWPETMNYFSGAAEVAGGFGILIPILRKSAGWGLMALLFAVFPANLQVALHGWPGHEDIPAWVLWVRLPFQVLFMAWVYWTSISQANRPRRP